MPNGVCLSFFFFLNQGLNCVYSYASTSAKSHTWFYLVGYLWALRTSVTIGQTKSRGATESIDGVDESCPGLAGVRTMRNPYSCATHSLPEF